MFLEFSGGPISDFASEWLPSDAEAASEFSSFVRNDHSSYEIYSAAIDDVAVPVLLLDAVQRVCNGIVHEIPWSSANGERFQKWDVSENAMVNVPVLLMKAGLECVE